MMKRLCCTLIGLLCFISGYSQVLLTEDFTTATGSTPPVGWTNNDLNSSGEVWEFNNPGGQTLNTPISSPAAIFDSDNYGQTGGPEDAALESPAFDASSGTIILTFDHYFEDGAGGGYAVEVYDGTDWDTIIDGTISTSDPQSESLDITALTGGSTAAKVRFHWTGDWSYYWIVDNIEVSAVSCLAPTALGVDNVALTTADLYWTTGGAADWNVEYGTAGFTLGTGTMVNATNDTLNIASLTSNTTYEFYVRDSCAVGDVSSWAGPYSFTTLCGVLAVPYSESFASITPACWGEAGDGTPSTGPTSLGSTDWGSGPLANLGPSEAYEINLYDTGKNEWVISPEFNLTGGPFQVELDFAIMEWNDNAIAGTLGSDDEVQLLITTNGGTTWTALKTWDNTSAVAVGGQHYVIDLTTYTGSTAQFAVWATEGTTDDSEDNDISFDNFEVALKPSCADPSVLGAFNITATSADLFWTGGGASDWNVEYGATGFTIGTGIRVNATNDTIAVNPLSANTTYDFYVRDSCAVGDVSSWVGPFSFTTLCAVVQVPFTETWETASPTVGCWSAQTPWALSTTASANGMGSNSIIFPFYSVPSGSVDAFSPEFSPVPAGYQLSFDHAYSTYQTEVDSAKIYYSTDGGATYTLLVGLDGGASGGLTTVPPVGLVNFVPTASQWDNYSIGLPVGTNKLKITAKSAYGNNLYLDNISVEVVPLCPSPTALGATNITTTTADVYWTTGGSSTWNVEYGVTGFNQGNGSFVSLTMNDTTMLSSLTPQTCYDFYVQDVCAADSSTWVGPFNFCTPGVSTACNVSNTFENDTVCTPGPTSYASLNGNQVVMLNSNGEVTSVDDTLNFSVTGDSTLNPLTEAVKGNLTGHVGPLTNLPGGFGNYTAQGQWISVLDTIRIDSMTVRANGVVTGQMKIMDDDPLANPLAQVLQRSKLFTTGSATADYQVEIGVILTPGTYFIALDFPGGTGSLYRSTGGAVYPYVLPGLMSIDSVNFAGARIYYTFDMVVSEYCLSPSKTLTTYLIGQNAGLDRTLVLCDDGATVDMTTYLSANATAGGSFLSVNGAAAISGNILDPSALSPGYYDVYYQTSSTSACPADSAEFTVLVQSCSGCSSLTAPATTNDTVCGPDLATLTATGSNVVWYNPADSVLFGGNSFSDSVATTTSFNARSILSAGPALVVGPPMSVNQNPYPIGNYTNGQYITVGQTVRIDSATFAVNGALDFVVAIQNLQKTDTLQYSEMISFTGADTAAKEVGIVLTPGSYFIGTIPLSGPGILWRMEAGANFPYGVPGYFTADSSDFGPARYYYLHEMQVSSACISSAVTAQAVVSSAFNAGASANDTVCDTLMIDLSSYLGPTFDAGGSWIDVDGTAALSGNMFDAYQVAKNSTYTFQYTGGSGACGDTATISLYVDFCSIGIEEPARVSDQWSVYPNPTTGSVFVESLYGNYQTMTLEIYSVNGQLLYRKSISGNEKAEVEMNGLADGMYNLRIVTDDGASVRQVIKK